jgi:hypothetical protein
MNLCALFGCRNHRFTRARWAVGAAMLWLTMFCLAWPFASVLAFGAVQTEEVVSVTLSPATIAGGSGNTSSGTLTLSAPAPPGGTVVTLTSSNVGLAAALPSVTVPEGQTTATFTVATNARYRSYSGLGFSVTISATHRTTRSAVLNVTAQPRPPAFNSGSQAGSNTQWEGSMCGGIAPIGGHLGILYTCSPAGGTGFGSCTFQQECSLGCRRVPPNGGSFNDFCATSGANPVAVSRNYFTSGDHVPATVSTGTPVTIPTTAVPRVINTDGNARSFSPDDIGGIHFPTGVGATSVPFDVATSYVPTIQFVDIGGFWFDDDIAPLLITNGRGGQVWAAMVPPEPAPAQPIPTPVQFKIVGLNPVTGGQSSHGQIHTSGIPHGIGPTITFTSSHPHIVPPPEPITPDASNILGFDVNITTAAPPLDTDVTLTATDGRYTFSAVLTVRVPPPPPVLADLTVNPTSITGGGSAIATVRLSAPQSGATVIALSTPAPSNVATMPSSVTVPAGATSVSFTVATFPVTSQFNMNIFADLAGSPGQQALLLIMPSPATGPTLAAVSVNPTNVVGGNASTGTVSLSAAAPSGGFAVALSDNSAAASTPASLTVPAGATSATFTVTTVAVSTSTIATVTATAGGTSRTANLTIAASAGGGGGASGFLSPAAHAPESGGDGNGFQSNPVNAFADDAAAAADTNSGTGTSTSCTNSRKDRHRFYDFGLAVPAGSAIAGLEVRLDARADSTSGSPRMCVQLSWDGGTTWTAAKATGRLRTSLATFTVGGPSDTWGRTWSAADLANANFRVRVINVAGSTSRDFFLDWVAVQPHVATTGPAAPAAATLTVTATGRSGEVVSSTPTGIRVNVGSAASASFAVGTSITLRISDGREAIWSGACSSGGEKERTCTFTLNGSASVTANVQ